MRGSGRHPSLVFSPARGDGGEKRRTPKQEPGTGRDACATKNMRIMVSSRPDMKADATERVPPEGCCSVDKPQVKADATLRLPSG